MNTLVLRSRLSALSSYMQAIRQRETSTRVAFSQVVQEVATSTSGSKPAARGMQTGGEPVQWGRATLVWCTVEMEDGRLEWRVVEDESMPMGGGIASGPDGVAA